MIEFRVLGPLEARAGGRVIDVGGPKQRALLAMLLLRANEPVPRGVLVHQLWHENPPAGAHHTLEVYVSRLRKTLDAVAEEPVVLTRPGAYLPPDRGANQLDLNRFERLAEGGPEGAGGERARTGGGAFLARRSPCGAVRRSPTLGDEPFAQVEIARLEELRIGLIEDRIEADLGPRLQARGRRHRERGAHRRAPVARATSSAADDRASTDADGRQKRWPATNQPGGRWWLTSASNRAGGCAGTSASDPAAGRVS